MRRIVEDYEAKLKSTIPSGKARGKMERKRYGNGEEVFSVRFKLLGVPDGTRVSIEIDAKVVGALNVEKGAGRFKLSSELGDDVPEVVPGQAAAILCAGTALLSGVFEPD